jgi:hypothetical protein
MQFHRPATARLPLCRPAGWAALWRRLANCAALNA